MVSFVSLLRNGLLPRELPPPFTSVPLGNLADAKNAQFPVEYGPASKFVSLSCTHNLARVGSLRRQLKIPNPVNFYQLSAQVAADWGALNAHCAQSAISLSTPSLVKTRGRAIGRKQSLDELPASRAKVRATSKYILQTDISSFYPSLYTHTIPWALNTKAATKVALAANQLGGLFGNALDKFVRNGQGKQTIGIPIGPDTSLVIAETVLTAADLRLCGAIQTNGFRYMDDFEIGFNSYASAESALAAIQQILNEFELQLNPSKTKIVDLPAPIESPAISELRIFDFTEHDWRTQRYELIRYFNRAFELAATSPQDPILKYAISRMDGERVEALNWSLYQNLILQCGSAEPGTLQFVIDQLAYYRSRGYPIDIPTVSEVFGNIIESHAGRGHGSEVAWAIWGSILLTAPVQQRAVAKLIGMEDSVVALLALDANAKGLLGGGFSSPLWDSLMTSAELQNSQWLLAYEANLKGWLPSVGGGDHVAATPAFKWLKDEGVYFYNQHMAEMYQPRKTRLAVAAGGGGGGLPGGASG